MVLALHRRVGLLSKGLAQPLLLLGRKVGRDDLEVKLLELLDHPVLRSPAGQRKQRRRPGCYLLAYRFDEVIVYPDVTREPLSAPIAAPMAIPSSGIKKI